MEEHYRYLIGERVYIKLEVDSVGPIQSLSLGDVTLWQENVTNSLGKCFLLLNSLF